MLVEPPLFPYQQVGAEFLAARKYAALFDGMRMGKTRQFLKAARIIGAETIGVVAKASGVYVWEKEAREWGFDPIILKAGDEPVWGRFNIFSYNGLISELHEQLLKICYDLVGGDEADAFKSLDAARTQKFYGFRPDKHNKNIIVFDPDLGLCAYADRVWVMTGTPVLNNPSELYPMMRCLFFDALMDDNGIIMTFNKFCGKFCKYGKNNGFGAKIVGGKNLAKLRDLLRGRCLRRTKEEVWEEWKEPIIDLLPVPGSVEGIPSEEIRLVREALADTEDVVAALAAVAPHCATLRRLTGLAKVNGVVQWIDDNIEECEKLIVFAHHKEVISTLKSKLKHKYVEIIGGMSSEAKYNAYTAFQEDPSVKIFIGQNQAARDSIPLWKASTTISIEPDWVPGNNDQMLDRMTHFSKKEPCVGYFATLRGSIDEDIQKANIRKREITGELGLN